MIKVGVVGATGYAGAELCRLLLRHEKVKLSCLVSQSFEGKRLSDIYPAFFGICDEVLTSTLKMDECDVVFAAVPHGLSEEWAENVNAKGSVFIDLGADFRLNDENEYISWYGGPFKKKDLHKDAVYGLPEIFREDIRKAKIIANPGCYPTSAALGLYPVLKNNLCSLDGIVIDSKSGVTGSGRVPSETNHFAECNEAFAPYKVASHRHTPEIEQTLSIVANKKVKITFVPHLLPINRGILSTIYLKLNEGVSKNTIVEAYKNMYSTEKFVRFLEYGKTANLKNVKCTNYCDISVHVDERTNTLIIVSVIDNMVKGAAGQAVQNMNLAFGLDESLGLDLIPPSF